MYRQAENLNRKLKRRESGLDTVTSEVEALHARAAILNEELRVTQAASIELQLKTADWREIFGLQRGEHLKLWPDSQLCTLQVSMLCVP